MNASALNAFDYLVLSIILFSVLFALMRGLIASLLSLLGWVLSVYLIYKCYPLLEPYLLRKFDNHPLIQPLGYGVLLIGFLVFFAVINTIIVSAVGSTGFKTLDRMLGFVFGILRGGLIVSFFFLCSSLFFGAISGVDHDKEASYMPPWVINSQTYPYLKTGKMVILSTLNKHFDDKIDAIYESIIHSSNDERFVEYAVKKLESFVPYGKLQEIKKNIDGLGLGKSQREVEKLRKMFDYYKRNLSARQIRDLIPEEEFKKIDRLLNGNIKTSYNH